MSKTTIIIWNKKYEYYLYTIMNRFGLLIIALFIGACQSPEIVRKESVQHAKKKFRITKADLLKNFKKTPKYILYSNPKISDYFNFAIWNNKDIDIQLSTILKLYSQAKSIYYEDPTFEIKPLPIYSGLQTGGPFIREFMFSQTFPTASKFAPEKNIIYKEITANYFSIIAKLLEIQKEISVNLLLWEKLKSLIKIKRQKILVLKMMKKYYVNSISFHTDQTYFEENTNINLKISSTKKEIINLLYSIKSIKNSLGNILYIKPYNNVKLPDTSLLKNLSKKNITVNFSKNPFLKKYKELIKKSNIEIQRGTKEFIPNITLNLGLTLKSMDPVGALMGKKGILSSIMVNLPIYQEKLKSQVLLKVFENFAVKAEYQANERMLLTEFIENSIENYSSIPILEIVNSEIKEVNKLNRYFNQLISLGKKNIIDVLNTKLMFFDYKEAYIEFSFAKITSSLKNRFLIGKFLLGE